MTEPPWRFLLWEAATASICPMLDHRHAAGYSFVMNITLPPEQQNWLEAQVSAGLFPSIEAAAQAAIETAMADNAEIENDSLEWAKPFVDKARADVESGNVLTHAEHKARMDKLLASIRG
jgi:Arc/MetJ-type ribon-helix-helix transcriptional regulator